MKLPRPEKLKIYYFNTHPNVGDALNVVLFENLFGIQVSHGPMVEADVVAIGSVLNHFLVKKKPDVSSKQVTANEVPETPIQVWGTGLMFAGVGPGEASIRHFKIHALRGELTRQAMSSCLGEEISCPLADPGLLAAFLVVPQKKKYDIGIIPHFIEAQDECFQKMKEFYPNSIVINVQDDPISVIQTIAQCKTILSTSLHGLILADSFGIPNHWCVYSDRVIGKGHKFRDYYSSYGLEVEGYDLNNGEFPTLEKIRSEYSIPYRAVCRKQYELLKSFPYKGISKTKTVQLYLRSIWTSLFR